MTLLTFPAAAPVVPVSASLPAIAPPDVSRIAGAILPLPELVVDVAAEQLVAGWLIQCDELGEAADWQHAEDLGPDHFTDAAARAAWQIATQLRTARQPVSPALVLEAAEGRLRPVELAALLGAAPTSLGFAPAVQRLRALREQRRLVRAGGALARAAATGEDLERVAEEVSEFLTRRRGEAPGFTIWQLSQVLDYAEPRDTTLLTLEDGTPAWHEGEPMLLLGPGGVGKSRLSIQFAVCQIIGATLLGLRLPRPARRWLFIGNENSVTRWKTDLARICRSLHSAEQAELEKNLLIHALAADTDFDLALDDPEVIRRWRATAARCQPDIVVVDPWEAVIPRGDCNDAAATREGVRLLRAIFRPYNPRFSLVIVHHAREGAQAARQAVGYDAGSFAKGSKTLRSIARFVLNVAPGDADDGSRIVMACGKSNNAARFATRSAVLNLETGFYEVDPLFDLDGWKDDVDGKTTTATCSIREIVDIVRAGHEDTQAIVKEAEKTTGAGLRTIKRWIARAVEAGYLRQSAYGRYALGKKTA